MDTKKEPAGKKVPRKTPERYDLKTKCEAVLAVWSERRKPAEVCRELGINWAVLSGWQNRAMEGMMRALSPKAAERPAALHPLLKHRLAQELAKRAAGPSRLQQRLKAVEAPPETAKE